MVRLAKAHTDLALKISVNQTCFVSYGDASGGKTRAEQAPAVHVALMADMALLERRVWYPGNPTVLSVSWRAPQLKVTGCVLCGAKWYRVSGYGSGETKKAFLRSSQSQTRRAIMIIFTTRLWVPKKTGGVPSTWPLLEKTYSDHGCSSVGLMERLRWQKH